MAIQNGRRILAVKNSHAFVLPFHDPQQKSNPVGLIQSRQEWSLAFDNVYE